MSLFYFNIFFFFNNPMYESYVMQTVFIQYLLRRVKKRKSFRNKVFISQAQNLFPL